MVEFFSGSVLLWLLSISQIINNAEGSSQRSKPIKNISYVSDVQIDVKHSTSVSSQFSGVTFTSEKNDAVKQSTPLLCSQDAFLLHFSLSQRDPHEGDHTGMKTHDSKEHFTLFLKPTHSEFLHRNAKITYQSSNSSDVTTQSMISDEILTYSGSVVRTEHLSNSSQSHWESYDQKSEIIQLNSWANILVHHPYGKNCVQINKKLIFEGAFEVHQRTWHIKSLHSYQKSRGLDDSEPTSASKTAKPESNMVAWSDSEDWATRNEKQESRQEKRNDSMILSQSNSVQIISFQEDPDTPNQHYLRKRQTMANDMAGSPEKSVNYGNTIGSTDGCPQTLKMVYMGIAVDCTYLRKYGSVDSVRLAVLNNMNIVSSLYQRTFNVSLGIIEINIPAQSTCPLKPSPDRPWDTDCPSSSSSGGLELSERLDQFSQWRSQKGSSDGAGLWHLMTDCPNGSEVGISWLGALCKVNAEEGASGGITSGTGLTAASPNEWQTMAHEIGHNFGAVHDCTSDCSMGDSCCPASKTSCSGDKQYLMAPSSSGDTSLFSPCSIGNICSSLKEGNDQGVDSTCVADLGQHYTTSLNQCGNGILEPGEECDTGATYSPCCQWGVCKFSPGAVCTPGLNSPCCSSTCQFSPPATPCNSSSAAKGQCPGNSPQCF